MIWENDREARLHDVSLLGVYHCLGRSLDLLDRLYTPISPGLGGWYHRLEAGTPGPSATAAALHCYLMAERLPRGLTEGLAFLRERQVASSNNLLDGGWAVNTSGGRPVLEATSLVLRLLGFAHIMPNECVPDANRAYKWIINNQNRDGGWGSFSGQPSRTWLTAMAIRALGEVNRNDPSVSSGVEWLLRERDPNTGAWGELPRGSATVTHTAFVLTCLRETRIEAQRPYVGDATRLGFAWLQAHLDAGVIFDDKARVETYNVTYEEQSHQLTWQNSVWHPSLPFALSALIRHPEGADPGSLSGAINKIIAAQMADGRWANPDGSAGISIWSVWPFVESLSDLVHKSPLRPGDRITWLSKHSILICRGPDTGKSLARLSCYSGATAAKALLKRHWATVLFLVSFIAGAIFTKYGVLDAKDAALALVLPVFLLFIQEVMAKRRSSSR